MFLQVHFLNLHTFNQKLDIVKLQCGPSIRLFIWTQFLQFFCLKYPVWRTWFLLYFKLGFYRLQQAEKSSSNWEKIQFIKLENCKNQVQIDMRNDKKGYGSTKTSLTVHTVLCEIAVLWKSKCKHRKFLAPLWRLLYCVSASPKPTKFAIFKCGGNLNLFLISANLLPK